MDENGAESTKELHFFYDAQSTPAFVEYDGVMYRYVHNLQGDTVAIVDAAGNLVVEYRYDAWGKLISTTGSLKTSLGQFNPFRYRRYVWDEDAELYYLEARFYNACLQKFIIPDLLLGSLNSLLTNSPYTYCRNNAINMADNGGLWPKWLGAVATAVVATIIVAAVIPAAVCTASVVLATYAISSTAITVGVAAVGTFALSSHYSNAIEAVTGTNPIRDVVLGGNDEAYDYYQLATYMAGAGVLHMAAVSPGVCFVEGTPILTENGFKSIEEIAVGERVWAQDVETGECVLRCVLHTFINKENEFVHIYIDEEEIVCTMDHPFYVVGKGWIPARDLKKCDGLRIFDGKTTCVKSVLYEEKAETVAAYNLEPLSVADMQRICNEIPLLEREEDRRFLAIQISMALRPCEVLGLQWQDVDLENNLLHIRRNVVHPDRFKPEVKETKTEGSYRTIPISSIARPYLTKAPSEGFIFGGKEPLRYQAFRDVWKRIREKIDLCGATGYTFRHTVLTDLYDATKDVKTTQRYAGHSNPDMTMRRYVHGREECSQELARRLDQMYMQKDS